MSVKRRIQISLVLLCVAAAAFGIWRWQINMGVWGNAWAGDLPALKQQLDQGGNPDSSWQGLTALGGAIHRHHRQAAVLLLDRGANPDTSFTIAVRDGDPALVDLMFAHGLDAHGKARRDALSTAIDSGRADMVALLLRHGVDPNARNPYNGRTPLQEAHAAFALEQPGSPRILALLRAAGAK